MQYLQVCSDLFHALTKAVYSTTYESWITATLKTAISVSTCGIWMAVVNTKTTLINI